MDLPSYDRPPVAEVALSIQCAPISKLTNIHVGLLWNELKADFPKYQEQPTLPPAFEVFGAKSAAMLPSIELLTTAPVNRYWFINANGSELIQIQQDRIVYNWRKQAEDDVYPRYESIREHFVNTSSRVIAFLSANELGPIVPNQCEVTYINYVTLPDGTDPHATPQRILAPWSGTMTDDYLPELEDLQMQLRFPIKQDGKNIGRLYVQVAPAMRMHDKKPGFQITLTARGRPQNETIESAFDLLDVCRVSIVRGFTSVTTQQMHVYWGRHYG